MALHTGQPGRPHSTGRDGNPFATVANPAVAQQVAPPLNALADLKRLLPELRAQPAPLSAGGTGFHH
jgi:hypothetical protein